MRQELADYWMFLREFRRTFESTGALMPSGPALSAALARFVREGESKAPTPSPLSEREDFRPGRRILEVGPGTGAVTHHIVRGLRDGDRLDLVERNSEFVARLRERLQGDAVFQPHADRITLHHAGVEELAEDDKYDLIVSGLPLNNFSVNLVAQILAKFKRLMSPGATLSFFEYIAIRRAKAVLSRQAERERLRGIGRLMDDFLRQHEIDREPVWANVPPAWVHHVRTD